MNRAADIYLKENDKMAGFVSRFSKYCEISYDYGKKLNRARKVKLRQATFQHRNMKICHAETFVLKAKDYGRLWAI